MAVVLALAACGTEKGLPLDPSGPAPDPDATYTRVQGEIFTPSCALSGCHAGAVPRSGLDLSAGVVYQSIVGVPSVGRADFNRIEPRDPERSYLVKKVRGDADIAGSSNSPRT